MYSDYCINLSFQSYLSTATLNTCKNTNHNHLHDIVMYVFNESVSVKTGSLNFDLSDRFQVSIHDTEFNIAWKTPPARHRNQNISGAKNNTDSETTWSPAWGANVRCSPSPLCSGAARAVVPAVPEIGAGDRQSRASGGAASARRDLGDRRRQGGFVRVSIWYVHRVFAVHHRD